MKNKFNKTWLIISSIIIFNILIFSFLSKKLEIIVIDDMAERSVLENNF